ncbi:hypothetical protein VP01_3143g2 [Puccinia sorghi]|uniref:Uncharacterized protein n=1 Tax=Puccinia sorghi TaxID=27349 RepID=A0A0L6UZR9_9BASI|nr:hypothetical protein VP01_3143g2 [Puccinia sorghi]
MMEKGIMDEQAPGKRGLDSGVYTFNLLHNTPVTYILIKCHSTRGTQFNCTSPGRIDLCFPLTAQCYDSLIKTKGKFSYVEYKAYPQTVGLSEKAFHLSCYFSNLFLHFPSSFCFPSLINKHIPLQILLENLPPTTSNIKNDTLLMLVQLITFVFLFFFSPALPSHSCHQNSNLSMRFTERFQEVGRILFPTDGDRVGYQGNNMLQIIKSQMYCGKFKAVVSQFQQQKKEDKNKIKKNHSEFVRRHEREWWGTQKSFLREYGVMIWQMMCSPCRIVSREVGVVKGCFRGRYRSSWTVQGGKCVGYFSECCGRKNKKVNDCENEGDYHFSMQESEKTDRGYRNRIDKLTPRIVRCKS